MPERDPLQRVAGATPAPLCATWVDPPGPRARPAFRERHDSSAYEGMITGAWGGRCAGRACVVSAGTGFDAELALDAGDAVNAVLRGGGHRRDAVRVDDPGLGVGQPVPVRLQLAISSDLAGRNGPLRGWGADPGGAAFAGSEDHERRPLRLHLPLDPVRGGHAEAAAEHPLLLPNRCWTVLPLRFAAWLCGGLGRPLHWRLRVRLSVRPERAGVFCRVGGAGAGGPAPRARHGERESEC